MPRIEAENRKPEDLKAGDAAPSGLAAELHRQLTDRNAGTANGGKQDEPSELFMSDPYGPDNRTGDAPRTERLDASGDARSEHADVKNKPHTGESVGGSEGDLPGRGEVGNLDKSPDQDGKGGGDEAISPLKQKDSTPALPKVDIISI